MRGHLVKRAKGSWSVVVDVGVDPATGRRRQKWYTVRGTRHDAERFLAAKLHEVTTGQWVEPANVTLAVYLEDWLEQAATQVRPSTWESYKIMVRRHIAPALGGIALQRLTAMDVQRWCRQQLATGRQDGRGQALSARTVRYMYAVLRMALRRALKLGLVSRDVTGLAQPPRVERRELPSFDHDVALHLVRASEGARIHLPILLALMTGMRRGEIFGLTWSSVDLERGTLEIRQTLLAGKRLAVPKTDRARRRVAVSPGIVAALKAQHRQQAEYRLVLGADYDDHDLVICLEDGRPWDPAGAGQMFRRLVRRAGLDGLRFHDMRHLHATHLLREGIHPKVVADRLGHSHIAVTLDTYSHVLPDLQREAAEVAETILDEHRAPRTTLR